MAGKRTGLGGRRVWTGLLALLMLALGGMLARWLQLPAFVPSGGAPDHLIGVYHVHSARSHDSTVPPEAWAAAAAQAGLDFIVLTDHNVEPQEPQVFEGVLVLFERESSTAFGHRVELGGAAIAAHPTDPKRPWLGPLAEMSGLEIASASASVRRLAGPAYLSLLPTLSMGLIRPDLGLLQVYDRDHRALQMWDREAHRPLAGLCSADAHGWLPLSMELSLWRVALAQEGMGRPLGPKHAPAILHGLASGRAFCVAGALPAASSVQLRAREAQGPWLAAIEGRLPADRVHALEARVDVAPQAAGRGMRLNILQDGVPVCTTSHNTCTILSPKPGVYRSEVTFVIPNPLWGERRVPLMYSSRLLLGPMSHD